MGSPPGQVITFYSYKGGTGRTMALANVASLMALEAAGGQGVLMVDWDLDAPGLHEYFRPRLQRQLAGTPEPDWELDARPGVIDLFVRYREALGKLPPGRVQTRDEARRLVEEIDPLPLVLETGVSGLHLLKAGRFDAGYSASVSTFPWEDLYKRSPWLVQAFAERLTGRYRYVLVDSRTGLNDISGICTMLLPERLVAVFTPNRQSLFGVYDLIRRATNYRRQSPDLRPLVAFPLPSRIDSERRELRRAWRHGDPARGIDGFQAGFEKLFKEVYDLEDCSLEEYFREVQIQHTPDFAYGEEVAALTEWGTDRFDLTRSYERFSDVLIHSETPWALSQGPELGAAQERARRAEAAFNRLSPEQQESARRIFTRLVRLALPGEGGRDTGIAVPRLQLAGALETVDALVAERVLKLDDRGRVELADESLIQAWARLGRWLQEDREFLLWRQGLRSAALAWLPGQPQEALLTGKPLEEARRWLAERRFKDLNAFELDYIIASDSRRSRQAALKGVAAGLLLLVVVLGAFWINRSYQARLQKSLLQSWGLPADLYERQSQLHSLSLPSSVNRVDWLAEGLEELDLGRSKVESPEGLPASLKSLEINLESSDLTGLPESLESLQLRASGLQEPGGLPPNLRRLTMEAPLQSLAGLPRSLQELSLERALVPDLEGLPLSLRRLELAGTAVRTLNGLPTSVKDLALQGNSLLQLEELPPGLLSLQLHGTPGVGTPGLPQGLRSLDVDVLRPGPIPGSLESLRVQTLSAAGASLPQGLKRLEISIRDFRRLDPPKTLIALQLRTYDFFDPGSKLAFAESLPVLEELDLIGLDMVAHLTEFPARLKTLRIRFGSLGMLPPLPVSLELLDLSGSNVSTLPKLPAPLRELSLRMTPVEDLGNLPPGLTALDVSDTKINNLRALPTRLRQLNLAGTGVSSLEGLPPGLTSLDISRTQIKSLRGLPPNLEKLTLSAGQVASLEGLPETVDELVFVEAQPIEPINTQEGPPLPPAGATLTGEGQR